MEPLNLWAGSLAAAGWSHFVQTAILAGLLALVDATLGRRLGAHWRCALWLLLFVKLALPPQLALPTSPAYWWPNHSRLPAASAETFSSPAVEAATPGRWSTVVEPVEAALPDTIRRASTALPSWQLLLVAGWGAGMVTLAGVTSVRHHRLSRTLRRSVPASGSLQRAFVRARDQLGLSTRVTLRLTDDDIVPLVAGVWRPVVYLPQSLAKGIAADQRHAILVHELYHIKRGDLWVTAMQTIARIVFFHHPVVWLVNARLNRLREEATDQAVLSHREVDRQSYSFALVAAAALIRRTAPTSRFALGVIETKSQLQKRITMNLHQPRSARVHLGLPGLLSLVALAFVLVPMTPAQPVESGMALASELESTGVGPLLDRVDHATGVIIDAFNRRDRSAYVAAFTPDSILLPDGAGLAAGRSDVGQMYLQVPTGLVYEGMVWGDRQLLRIDRWIIETGQVGFNFRLTPDAPIMSDPRQAFTIWEDGPGDTLLVKLLAWNQLGDPAALHRPTQPKAFAAIHAGGAMQTGGDFDPVLEAEAIFHRALAERRLDDTVKFYGDAATLMVPGKVPLRGSAAIDRHLQATGGFLTAIEREVAHVEGNENHVLVVNLFRWTVRPTDADVLLSVAGKGVHLWQRGKDGTWRILFDLHNVNQPNT